MRKKDEMTNSAKHKKKYQKPELKKYKSLKKVIATVPVGITEI